MELLNITSQDALTWLKRTFLAFCKKKKEREGSDPLEDGHACLDFLRHLCQADLRVPESQAQMPNPLLEPSRAVYPPGLPSGCKAGTRRPVCLADRLFQASDAQ